MVCMHVYLSFEVTDRHCGGCGDFLAGHLNDCSTSRSVYISINILAVLSFIWKLGSPWRPVVNVKLAGQSP